MKDRTHSFTMIFKYTLRKVIKSIVEFRKSTLVCLLFSSTLRTILNDRPIEHFSLMRDVNVYEWTNIRKT